MEISIWGNHDASGVDEVVHRVAVAADQGFRSIWFPQTWSFDTLTALAVAARAVPDIRIGAAVVPIQGRHPIPLAQQALTVADAAGRERFTLGIGVAYPAVSEGWYGIPYASVVSLCAEQLEALVGLLSPTRSAEVSGKYLTARVQLDFDAPAPALVVGALGPKMLELAGRLSDGTVTWMTGIKTVAKSIVPLIRQAAAQAGRDQPRVIVGLPVCVTDEVARVRSGIGPAMAEGAKRPSYRRMIAAEGVAEAVDIALIGAEEVVARQLDALWEAGATELIADIRGNDAERARTMGFLAAISQTYG